MRFEEVLQEQIEFAPHIFSGEYVRSLRPIHRLTIRHELGDESGVAWCRDGIPSRVYHDCRSLDGG